MKLLDARRTRRLLLELEPGDALPDALEAGLRAARARTATVRGTAQLDQVDLLLPDPDPAGNGLEDVARRLDGSALLVTCEGWFDTRGGDGDGLELRGLLARETDRGPDLLGGVVAGARVVGPSRFELELLEDFDEVPVSGGGSRSRSVDDHDADEAQPARAPAAASGAWAAVAAASEAAQDPAPAPRTERRRGGRRERPGKAVTPVAVQPDPLPTRRRPSADQLLSEPYPERGDHIDHRQFGRCRVDGEDTQGGLIIRLPSGRRKTINLDFLEVLPAEEGPDGRVFPVRPRRKS